MPASQTTHTLSLYARHSQEILSVSKIRRELGELGVQMRLGWVRLADVMVSNMTWVMPVEREVWGRELAKWHNSYTTVKTHEIEGMNVILTNCRAFTAPPDVAIDWRVLPWVLWFVFIFATRLGLQWSGLFIS
jgi:uncharacterized membrane protein